MASTHDMMPLYSASGNGPYHRTTRSQPYPQLDTKFAYPQLDAKPAYGSDWTAPYGDDTSPIEDYSFGQSSTYLPAPTTPAGSNMCGPSYRWTHPSARTNQPLTSCYSDYGHSYCSNGLPYLNTDIRPVAAAEPVSPLNMSSLQLTLPERPRQRQMQPTEVPVTPRRRLPAPQPKPGYGLHHALDHQQDQRLRSSQMIATPSYSNTGSFAKPLLPWAAANENLINAVSETTATTMLPPTSLTSTDAMHTSFPEGSSANDNASTTDTAPSVEPNFSTLPLLDPSTLTAPTQPAYSNFRESRNFSASTTTELSRNRSSSSLYTFDGASRRLSFPGDGSSSNLVSGHQYTPLSQPTDTPNMDNLTREPFESQNVPLHRASTSNLNSSF